MTTFNADGTADDQLTVPPDEVCAVDDIPAPTDAERAAALARVKGTAVAAAQDDDEPPREALAVVESEPILDDEPEDAPGTAIALAERFDVAKAGEDWPHDFLEFKGDLLGIRLPTRQALAAFSLASSKYVSLGVKNDLTGLFIARHLSPESYGRVFSRLMDPDETDYDVDTVGALFNAIVTAAVDADKAADKGKENK